MPDRDDLGSAWKVPPSRYLAGRPAEHRVGAPASVYVTMADGCRLAVDVILPDGDAAKRWPTVLILTPYIRRFELAAGSNIEPSPNSYKYRDMFVPRGYALVVVDARGTGASFGTRDSFRSPRERADYRAIADWIVAQPWSDGADRRHRHLLSRRGLRFPRQHRPPGGEGDRAPVRGVGHLGRQLLSRRHADQAAGAGLRRADAGARPRPARPARPVQATSPIRRCRGRCRSTTTRTARSPARR